MFIAVLFTTAKIWTRLPLIDDWIMYGCLCVCVHIYNLTIREEILSFVAK